MVRDRAPGAGVGRVVERVAQPRLDARAQVHARVGLDGTDEREQQRGGDAPRVRGRVEVEAAPSAKRREDHEAAGEAVEPTLEGAQPAIGKDAAVADERAARVEGDPD